MANCYSYSEPILQPSLLYKKTSAETSFALGEVNKGQVLREQDIARRAPNPGWQ